MLSVCSRVACSAFVFWVLSCFHSTAIFSHRNSLSWDRRQVADEKIRVDGLMTSHCGPCLANSKTQRPWGLNCRAWEGQVERRGSSCQRSCSFSSRGFPCAHIKGSFVAVWSLHSPLSKLLGSMFYPSSDSSYWYLKSALISFFSPSAHLGYLTGREFFSGMQGMKGEVCAGGLRCEGRFFLGW